MRYRLDRSNMGRVDMGLLRGCGRFRTSGGEARRGHPLTPFDRLRVSGDDGRPSAYGGQSMGADGGSASDAGRPVHGVSAAMARLHVFFSVLVRCGFVRCYPATVAGGAEAGKGQ